MCLINSVCDHAARQRRPGQRLVSSEETRDEVGQSEARIDRHRYEWVDPAGQWGGDAGTVGIYQKVLRYIWQIFLSMFSYWSIILGLFFFKSLITKVNWDPHPLARCQSKLNQ